MTFSLARFVRPIALLAALTVAACGSEFFIAYDTPVSSATSRNWRVVDVRVSVPESLVVSEAKTLFPRADIVWREDELGDRRAQVAAIMRQAVTQAVAPLQGSRRVYIDITQHRFHALTFEAEARLTVSGVYSIDYVAQVVDAATGEVLAGPTMIHSDAPAMVGAEAKTLRAQGHTQRSIISGTIRKTISGWLGLIEDPRTSFNRVGG